MAVELPPEMDALRDMSRGYLLELWSREEFGALPKKTSTPFLARLLAYELQARKRGGLRKRTRLALVAIESSGMPETSAKLATTGTRLVREWNGVRHVVDITKQGAVYRGKTYRSLSAVAREITGARWSGPRFFGLQRKGG
ncbi:DUF2924 domain-containing protein [Henriciella sp.]|uniref:DUF2924 domain-containing protein n=1 Tax=Henriciella sp. TaxID=1968823 RepID=UPI00260CE704|nr:DUF2924 domain-containing protein [Henriciella sp.]